METVKIGSFILVIIAVILLCLYCYPQYRVYSQRKAGEAELARAEFSRKVMVVEAEAKRESSSLLAAGDTTRAHGIARSNEIIGNSLRPQYLSWLWINNLEKQAKSVIYVPSVNGVPTMPIQEATRLEK